MKILLVYVSDTSKDGFVRDWIDSCWTEDKTAEAIQRAHEIREMGCASAVVAYEANQFGCSSDEWNDNIEEMVLDWNNIGG